MTIRFERGQLCHGTNIAEVDMTVARVTRRYGPVDSWEHVKKVITRPVSLGFFGGRSHVYSDGQVSNIEVGAVDKWTGHHQSPRVNVLESCVKGEGAFIQIGSGRMNRLRKSEKVYVGATGVVSNKKNAYIVAIGT